jgi:methionine aminopeptidase
VCCATATSWGWISAYATRGYFGVPRTVAVGQVSQDARTLMTVTAEALARWYRRHPAWSPHRGHLGGHPDVAERADTRSCGSSSDTASVASCTDRRCPTTAPAAAVRLSEGLVLAIEPMVNAGAPRSTCAMTAGPRQRQDGLSAHFGAPVAVTAKGPYILSQP